MEDFPETPAHVFAYRAFKTALFGTPAATQGEILVNHDETDPDPQRHQPNPQAERLLTRNANLDSKTSTSSPIKSILLTPGTTAQQRKTVTFSSLRDHGTTGNGTRGKENKQISRKQSFDDLTKPKDTVRRSLFQSPSEPEISSTVIDQAASSGKNEPPHTISATAAAGPVPNPEIVPIADITMDLKSPKSHSGKHWKSEYQREHDKTKAEMKRLIRYSQVAKSFAAKRDAEASRMREKLESADRKVKQLEEKVTQLAADLGGVQLEDNHHSELMEDLAVQTANALRYKQKAERYRAALQNEANLPTVDVDIAMGVKPHDMGRETVNYALEAPPSIEHNTREATLAAENETLRNTIARVKEEMQRYEERHRNWEENRRRRDERWATKRRELEDQLKQSREENKRLRADLYNARLSSSSHGSHSTPPSSHGTMQPPMQESSPAPQQVNQPTPIRSRPEDRQAKSIPTNGQIRDAVDLAISSRADAGLSQSHLQSSKDPSASIKAKCPKIDPQNETLDLWGLAASTDNRNARPKADIFPSALDRFKRPQSAAVESPQIADGSLWDNLKRRTSMSMMSNAPDVKLDQVNGIMKVGKENIQPAQS